VAAAGLVGVAGIIATVFEPKHAEFFWGLGVGGAAAVVMFAFDSPPWHIERWRVGANGERATARALRPLVAAGWTLVNDIQTGHGNIDHVLAGPPGVFLLDTKNLHGVVSVERGVLSVRWHEDPDDGYEAPRLARRVRGAAAGLHATLSEQGCDVWVQPIVVLWGSFDQRSLQSDGVAWIHGTDLATVLANRPIELSVHATEAVGQALRRLIPARTDP
jgi:hypothetical protein